VTITSANLDLENEFRRHREPKNRGNGFFRRESGDDQDEREPREHSVRFTVSGAHGQPEPEEPGT